MSHSVNDRTMVTQQTPFTWTLAQLTCCKPKASGKHPLENVLTSVGNWRAWKWPSVDPSSMRKTCCWESAPELNNNCAGKTHFFVILFRKCNFLNLKVDSSHHIIRPVGKTGLVISDFHLTISLCKMNVCWTECLKLKSAECINN